MNRPALLTLVIMVAPVAAGCSTARSSVQTNSVAPTVTTLGGLEPSTSLPPLATTTTSLADRPPHFETPETAMTYLATAWNNNDLVSLKHVTNPAARAQLDAMHSEATNLRLDHCDLNPAGDYTCHFKHDYPAGYSAPPGAPGEAVFLVGPADTPGWYMTVFESCG